MGQRSNSDSEETENCSTNISENSGERAENLPMFSTVSPTKTRIFGQISQCLEAKHYLPYIIVGVKASFTQGKTGKNRVTCAPLGDCSFKESVSEV